MNILTVKLPGELHATLTNEARRRNVTRSSLVRQIIENALIREADAESPSCLGLTRDLAGAVRSGRSDLATNQRLLGKAVAQNSHRAVADTATRRRAAREERLRKLGFEDPGPEQRREQLARNMALREWPNR